MHQLKTKVPIVLSLGETSRHIKSPQKIDFSNHEAVNQQSDIDSIVALLAIT